MAHDVNGEAASPAPGAPAPIAPPQLSNRQPLDGERRTCSFALRRWRELAAPRRYPTLAQVTRESMADLWEYLFVVAVGPEGTDHVFTRAGLVLRQALGGDPTGRTVEAALPREIAGRALYFQRAAVDLMAPIDETGRWIRGDGAEILYRAVLMPLSEDQRYASHLLGAFNFRVVAP